MKIHKFDNSNVIIIKQKVFQYNYKNLNVELKNSFKLNNILNSS